MKRFFAGERRDLNLIALSLVVWSLGEGLFMFFNPSIYRNWERTPSK